MCNQSTRLQKELPCWNKMAHPMAHPASSTPWPQLTGWSKQNKAECGEERWMKQKLREQRKNPNQIGFKFLVNSYVRFSCSLMFEFYVKPQIPYINSRFYLFKLSWISVTYHTKSSGWYNVNTTQTNIVTFPLTYGWQAVKRFYSSVRFVKLYNLFAKLYHAHISSI